MSAPYLSIKSNASDRELVFLDPRSDYFAIELRGAGAEARRNVYAYTDARGIAKLFSRLAAYERPWVQAQRWESLDGEFQLEARCSALGEVTFSVCIRDMLGVPEEWEVRANLVTELGQLRGIASRAEVFFKSSQAPIRQSERTVIHRHGRALRHRSTAALCFSVITQNA